MGKRRYYVFLCTNDRAPDNPKGSCGQNGAEDVRERFAQVVMREELRQTVRIDLLL